MASTKKDTTTSTNGVYSGVFTKDIFSYDDMGAVLNANKLYSRSQIEWYTKFNRFGCLDPYNTLGNTREYLFFTKPDLHIVEPGTMNLNPELKAQPFFVELLNRYPNVIKQLQVSAAGSAKYPFMNLLSNGVKNSLELTAITSDPIETSANIYGTAIEYRGSGTKSDENLDFSLEFEDTKYLEIYMLFRAYEEYERLKRIGMVSPPNIDSAKNCKGGYNYNFYIRNKVLHDQFSVYKFIVGEDYETIVFYCQLIGVFPKNVPRDTFSDMKVEGGLTYNVEFQAAFIDDQNPLTISDFNKLVIGNTTSSSRDQNLPIYNDSLNMVDGRWAKNPVIIKRMKDGGFYSPGAYLGPKDMQYEYKLQWRI